MSPPSNPASPRTPPIALTIAGSDPSGGAGIQADLKTFSALGVYGASVITALTAQNTRGVTAIHDPPPEFVGAQIDAVFDDLAIDAVKIGMLSRVEVIVIVADRLAALGAQAVVLKGGHAGGATSDDLLFDGKTFARLSAPRIATKNTHGTGCTFSSAIAANLAKGLSVEDAVRAAKAFVTRAIEAGAGLRIGGGHGPVHHFHALWPRE